MPKVRVGRVVRGDGIDGQNGLSVRYYTEKGARMTGGAWDEKTVVEIDKSDLAGEEWTQPGYIPKPLP